MKLFRACMTRSFWVRMSVRTLSWIQNIAHYMGRGERGGREWTKGNRKEKESRTIDCVDAGKRKRERESFYIRLSIRPITFAFSSRPSYHRTRIITSRSLFARSAFPAQPIFSFSSFFSLSLPVILLAYTAFVIKYGLKAYSLFIPSISRDYRETVAFFAPFSPRLR